MPSGSKILLESLKREGVKVMFGLPGGANLPIYDALADETGLRHILVRHEQCAAHAADGYARALGKPGVCMATSGPGATNLVTGICDAFMDSSPVISIAGQVPTHLIGTDAFQEADIFSLMLPITKHNFLVRKASDIARTVKMAFEIAMAGRPGPVHIDIPKDVQTQEAEFTYPIGRIYHYELPRLDTESVRRAVQLIANSERPVLLVGGGAIIGNASKEVLTLCEMLGAPVVITMMAKGVIPEDHPLFCGMLGMHGSKFTNSVIQESDCIIGIGQRWHDRATGKVDKFAPRAKKIHIDIDASEFGKNLKPDLTIMADVKEAVHAINQGLLQLSKKERKTVWSERLEALHREYPDVEYEFKAKGVRPKKVLDALMRLISDDDILTTEVGQCQMWPVLYCKMRKPRSFLTSGGLGSMGWGFPAAIGAKMARPESNVIDVAGDGSFLMNCMELATCVEEDIPVIVLNLDNRYLGMVRQWQELFYRHRYSGSFLGSVPDFVKLAEAFGAEGYLIERDSDIEDALRQALKCGKPAVVEVTIPLEENVFPIVPPGAPIDEVISGEQNPLLTRTK